MVCGGIACCSGLWWDLPSRGSTRVTMFNVGQGDGLLIVGPNDERILIDGGPDDTLLHQLAWHLPLHDRHIDLVILSHPHLDHLAALPRLVTDHDVGTILFTEVDAPLRAYERLRENIDARGTKVRIADPQQDLHVGSLTLDVIWPPRAYIQQKRYQDLNDASIAVRLTQAQHCIILLTGDLEAEAEHQLLASGAHLQCPTLKVAHHGSDTSSTQGVLAAVQPTLALISVGQDNRHGHPSDAVVQRLQAHGVVIKRTDLDGTQTFSMSP